MTQFQRILLASHGTPGAQAAEAAAFALAAPGAQIDLLTIVPEFWKGMLGDDWLNNAAAHIRFGRYVENQLEREIAEHAGGLARASRERGLGFEWEFRLGRPADCVLAVAAEHPFDLVVIGSPRPKGAPGFRSRLDLETLVRGLKVPLYVAPHPGR